MSRTSHLEDVANGDAEPRRELPRGGALAAFLVDHGVCVDDRSFAVAELSGGISNVVLRASWAGGCIVIKQSLPRLRVAADWQFDVKRIFVEAECMSLIASMMPGTCPEVVFVDRERHVLGMTCAPSGGVVWKDANLVGDLRGERAVAAARLLGRLQRATGDRADVAERFDDLMPLVQGRIAPYHQTVASVHADLAPIIAADIERLQTTRRVLVHGDFSPKNLIAYDDGTMTTLDFEVAHWGDPAFDPAFLLSHLVLGACYRPQQAAVFLAHAVDFWRVYRTEADRFGAPDAAVLAELGCLLLARIDGKSPVEYLTEDAQRAVVRSYARTLLLGRAGERVEDALMHAGAAIKDGLTRASP